MSTAGRKSCLGRDVDPANASSTSVRILYNYPRRSFDDTQFEAMLVYAMLFSMADPNSANHFLINKHADFTCELISSIAYVN
jgi:hypothetical protein